MPTLAESDHRGQTFSTFLRVAIDQERAEIVDALAEYLANGEPLNRSGAIRYLIDVHAGREVERLALEQEAPAAPYSVVTYAKPKLSRELVSFVAGSIAAGLSRRMALDLAGVTENQRKSWIRRGEHDSTSGKQSLYADLFVACKQAEAKQKAENIHAIRAHRTKVWTAAAWLLERGYPDEYGERKRIDGKVTHALEPLVDWSQLNATETKQLAALLRKASPASDAPGVTRTARPVAELLPADIDLAEWEELDDTEAPALEQAESTGSSDVDPKPGS